MCFAVQTYTKLRAKKNFANEKLGAAYYLEHTERRVKIQFVIYKEIYYLCELLQFIGSNLDDYGRKRRTKRTRS